MSLKHAILGFLSFQPFTGYDLKKSFDASVRHFWPANQSQIYRTLAQLTQEGFVTQEVMEREGLDKKVYHITDSGRQELHRWLAEPRAINETREPLLLQVFFGSLISDEEVLNVLRAERDAAAASFEQLKAIYQAYGDTVKTHENPRGQFLSLLTLEYGILGHQALLDWLASVIQRLETGDYSLRDFNDLTNKEHRE